ncbi:MAG: hypothetical protein U0736_28620, partial [Gemmataceae bacterium]
MSGTAVPRPREGWRFAAVVITALVASGIARPAAGPAGVARWADRRLPVARGLVLWLDAARLAEGRQAAGLPALKPGDPVDRWPDAAGGKRDVAQVTPAARPIYQPADGFAAVRFDGRAAHLRWSAGGPAARAVTVFVVAAPYPNRDGFPAFVSFGAVGRNDFETGLNIDQAIGSPPRFEVVNVETAGGQ